MKYLLIILISVTLFSCSQNADDLFLNDTEISFDIAGVRSTHVIASGAKVGSFYYQFSGSTSLGSNIVFIIPTDSLKVKTYHVTGNGSVASVTSVVYGYVMPGDYLDITITGYQAGVVNGTFSGNLSKVVSSNPAVFQPATVTGGVIKNVRVVY